MLITIRIPDDTAEILVTTFKEDGTIDEVEKVVRINQIVRVESECKTFLCDTGGIAKKY